MRCRHRASASRRSRTADITDAVQRRFDSCPDARRASGYRTLRTHIFESASEYLDSDAVFAVKPSVLREFVRRSPDDSERPADADGEWYSVENDLVLVPDEDSRPRTDELTA